jgi:endonuclease/exonuclease/phosphatase family metal-dependent hydrolase
VPSARVLSLEWARCRTGIVRGIAWLSWINLAAVVVIAGWLTCVGERSWIGTVITYLPRSPYLLPSLVLLPAALFWHRSAIAPNLLAAAIVLGLLMTLRGYERVTSPLPAEQAGDLRIITCNVQDFEPDFAQVLREIEELQPDIVAFQEAFDRHPLLATCFTGWHVQRVDEHLVASRYPLRFVDALYLAPTDRMTVARFEIDTPQGKVLFCSVHQTTPRYGLVELRPWSVLGGEAVRQVEAETRQRDEEAELTRARVDEGYPELPRIIVGDFNMPADSTLFRRHWGDLRDAFVRAGLGYGYTSPCHTRRIWPRGFPWLQVDHVLVSAEWEVVRCSIGQNDGSDHRLMTARLRLRGNTNP